MLVNLLQIFLSVHFYEANLGFLCGHVKINVFHFGLYSEQDSHCHEMGGLVLSSILY